MKKVLLIILGLLCTFSAFAIGYATPYKGSAHSGYIHTSASMHSSRSTMGLAQAPMASMSTTSSMSRGISYNEPSSTPAVQGIYTSASQISGGVTAVQTYAQMNGPHKAKKSGEDMPLPPGSCTECHWVWDPVIGDYVCTVCGSEARFGCDHMYEEGYCWCPLDLNWSVMLFFASLAAAYAVYKKRTQTV